MKLITAVIAVYLASAAASQISTGENNDQPLIHSRHFKRDWDYYPWYYGWGNGWGNSWGNSWGNGWGNVGWGRYWYKAEDPTVKSQDKLNTTLTEHTIASQKDLLIAPPTNISIVPQNERSISAIPTPAASGNTATISSTTLVKRNLAIEGNSQDWRNKRLRNQNWDYNYKSQDGTIEELSSISVPPPRRNN